MCQEKLHPQRWPFKSAEGFFFRDGFPDRTVGGSSSIHVLDRPRAQSSEPKLKALNRLHDRAHLGGVLLECDLRFDGPSLQEKLDVLKGFIVARFYWPN